MPKGTYFNLDEKRKEEIKDISMDLFINNPYDDIAIREIAEKLDISVGSFYKYFDSKEDMYIYFMDLIEEKLSANDDPSLILQFNPLKDLKSILNEKEYKYYNTWLKAPTSLYLDTYFVKYEDHISKIVKDLEKLHSEGKLMPHLDLRTAKYFISSSLFNFLMFVRNFHPTESSEEVFKKLKDYSIEVIYPRIIK